MGEIRRIKKKKKNQGLAKGEKGLFSVCTMMSLCGASAVRFSPLYVVLRRFRAWSLLETGHDKFSEGLDTET